MGRCYRSDGGVQDAVEGLENQDATTLARKP